MKRFSKFLAILLLITIVFQGGLRPETVHAASAKSVALTGSDSLRITSNLGITGDTITMETWINIQTAPASGDFRQILTFFRGATLLYKVWEIAYMNTGGTMKLSFQQGRICVANNYIQVNADLGTNAWHHVALTDNGTTVKGYLDGVEIASGASGGAGIFCTADEFNINDVYYENSAAHRLNAYYDEIRIWSSVRTQTEIDTNKCVTISSATNLRASYQFESDTTTDSSGNGYTLSTLVGSPALISSSPSCLTATAKARPIIIVHILDTLLKPEEPLFS